MYFFFLLLICFIVVPFLPWTHLCVSSSLLIYFFSRSDSFIDNDVLNSLFCSFIRSARFGLSLSLFSFRCMPVLYSSQCVSAPILKVFSSLILSLSAWSVHTLYDFHSLSRSLALWFSSPQHSSCSCSCSSSYFCFLSRLTLQRITII